MGVSQTALSATPACYSGSGRRQVCTGELRQQGWVVASSGSDRLTLDRYVFLLLLAALYSVWGTVGAAQARPVCGIHRAGVSNAFETTTPLA